jgi:membrane protein
LFWLGLEGFAAIYFSSTITSDSRLYGAVGVVFSLLTWFIAIDAVIVLGAVIGDMCRESLVKRTGRAPRGEPVDRVGTVG